MINTPQIGKIYDTLFYCVKYFNENSVQEMITNYFTDPSFMEVCYQEIKETIPTLPPILAPIFLYQDQMPTAMTVFFDEQIDFKNDTIDTFLKKIASKSDIIYSEAVNLIFHNYQNLGNRTIAPLIAPEAYIEALSDSDYSDNFKLQIALLFGNFNYAVSVLIEQLRAIYVQVDALHQKYAEKLAVEFEQIQSNRNIQLYKQLLDLDIAGINKKCYFAISLLNQYTTKSFVSDEIIALLIGFKHEENLNLQFDNQNIDLHQLLIAIGNDTRLAIIQTLIEKKELTASSIAKIIEIPTTTVLRHVEILYNCGIIYISKRSGLQIFYRLNYNLLMNSNKLIYYKLGGKANEQTNGS